MDRETWELHHRTLGVEPGASPERLKEAFRALAKQHHPDAVQGQEPAKRRGAAAFRAVKEAYEALKDCPASPPRSVGPEELTPAPPEPAPADWHRRAAALIVLAVFAVGGVHLLRRRAPPASPLPGASAPIPGPLRASPDRRPGGLEPVVSASRAPLAPAEAPQRPSRNAFERLEVPGDFDYKTSHGTALLRILPGTGEARAALMAARLKASPGSPEFYFAEDTGVFVGLLNVAFVRDDAAGYREVRTPETVQPDNGSVEGILVGPAPNGDGVAFVVKSAGGMLTRHWVRALDHGSAVEYQR